MLPLRAADGCTNQPKRAAAGFLRQPFIMLALCVGRGGCAACVRYPQNRCEELGGAARPACHEPPLCNGTGGTRGPSGHLHEVQSDPQVGSETSRGHG